MTQMLGPSCVYGQTAGQSPGAVGVPATASLVASSAAADQGGTQHDPAAARATLRQAARLDGVLNLQRQIEARPLPGGAVLASALSAVNRDSLTVSLEQLAREVGGPRWIEAAICQAQVQVDAEEVARLWPKWMADWTRRGEFAGGNPAQAAQALAGWRGMLMATGVSFTTQRARTISPPPSLRNWAGVSAEQCQQLIGLAIDNAQRNLLAAIEPLHKAEAMPRLALAGRRLDQAAVIQLRFTLENAVELRLFVPTAMLGDVAGVPVAGEQAGWRMAMGRATLRQSGENVSKPLVGHLFDAQVAPPAWLQDQLDSQGSATYEISWLKTARRAEADAQRRLRARVLALPLTADQTLGQRANSDADLARAVDRAIAAAHLYKTDYDPKGVVTVRISLELRHLWDQWQRAAATAAGNPGGLEK